MNRNSRPNEVGGASAARPVRIRPIRPDVLADELAAYLVGGSAAPPGSVGPARPVPTGRLRVLVDGAPPTDPAGLADELARRLPALGRPVVRVSAAHFPRPASLRLERGRRDPDELLTGWLDTGGLLREVLAPAGPDGSGRVLPRLWNVDTDRAFRDERVPLAPNGVLIVDGALLLGRGLPAELTVHLAMSPTALARRAEPDARWTLPAYARYAAERAPERADVLVLADDPTRPALVAR